MCGDVFFINTYRGKMRISLYREISNDLEAIALYSICVQRCKTVSASYDIGIELALLGDMSGLGAVDIIFIRVRDDLHDKNSIVELYISVAVSVSPEGYSLFRGRYRSGSSCGGRWSYRHGGYSSRSCRLRGGRIYLLNEEFLICTAVYCPLLYVSTSFLRESVDLNAGSVS